MKRWLLALAAAGYVGEAAASSTGASFLNVSLSVREMGMGNMSVGAGDVLGAWSNPAVLADQPTRGQAALTGSSMFAGQQSTFGLGASWLLSPAWSVGVLASSCSLSAPEVDATGGEVAADLERSLLAAGVASAWRLGPARAGVTLKAVSDTVLGDRATAAAVDAGVAASFGGTTVGAAYRNLGPSLRTAGEPGTFAESLPGELRAGAAYRLAGIRLTAGAELVQAAGEPSRIALGAEWWPSGRFGLRAGTADVGDAGGQITLGLSAVLQRMGLDYAMAAHPAGLTHRLSVSYAFGQGVADFSAARAAAAVPEPAPPPAAEQTRGVSASAETPTALTAHTARSTLAVADFASQGVSSTDSAVITELFRSDLVKRNAFDVVEKANMDKILAEQTFQQSGCTTAECAVRLGRILNVRYLIVGTFGKLMDQYVLNFRVVETETAKVIYSDDARELSTQREVSRAIVKMVDRFVTTSGVK